MVRAAAKEACGGHHEGTRSQGEDVDLSRDTQAGNLLRGVKQGSKVIRHLNRSKNSLV